MYKSLLVYVATAMLGVATTTTANSSAHSRPDEQQNRASTCAKHERPTTDCHVHDVETYQHLRMQDREKLGEHAKQEMKQFERELWQRMRN